MAPIFTQNNPHERPADQEIARIVVDSFIDSYSHEQYWVGANDVTRIEAFVKSGMYANIPYVRVWKGDIAVAEFCQHNIVGVYFKEALRSSLNTTEKA